LLALELFAKVFTDERMGIELAGIVRIFSCEKFWFAEIQREVAPRRLLGFPHGNG